MELNRVLIVGLGAIGSVYASKLSACLGSGFAAIASGARKERICEGVWVNGVQYRFNVADAEDGEAEPADLILFTVKNTQMDEAMKDAAPFVADKTVLMSLLNGLKSEEKLESAFGAEKVLYAKAFIDAKKDGDAVTTAGGGAGRILLGERDGAKTERAAAVAKLLNGAGIPTIVSDNIIKDMWYKFMINVGANQISAVLGTTYNDFRNGFVRRSVELAMREVVAISQKAGTGLEYSHIDKWLNLKFNGPGKSSMLQDVETKRKTEVEYFAGHVMELGERYGVPTPVNELLYNQIRAIEYLYKKGTDG